MMQNIFNSTTVDKFNDWELVTHPDGTIDLGSFLTLISQKLPTPIQNEEFFRKQYLVILQLEQLLGPFTKDQAISIAIMFTLAK